MSGNSSSSETHPHPHFPGVSLVKHRQHHKVAPMDESARIRRTTGCGTLRARLTPALRIGGLPERRGFSGRALVRRSIGSELCDTPGAGHRARQFVLRLTLFVPGLCSVTGLPVGLQVMLSLCEE